MRGLPADRPLVTARRLEILRLAANGHTNAGIAARLRVTEEAVKSHMRLTYEQLGARDRTHAIAICLVRGLIHPHEIQLLPPRGPKPPRPAHDAGPTVAEAAADDRAYWTRRYDA